MKGTQTIFFPCSGHALESDREELDRQLYAYFRHLKGEYDYTLPIEPMPTPRPRATARMMGPRPIAHIYNPHEYTKYKDAIKLLLKDAKLGIKPGSYSKLFVGIYLAYPKSTPAKRLIDGHPHTKKPDWDNYVKGIQDALEDAGILLNDGAISDGAVMKRYTTRPQGFISFNLL